MPDRRAARSHRGPIAASFDAMTLTIFVVMMSVAACSVLEVGPAQALDRVGCGVSAVVGDILAEHRACR